jgi:hypothetical protein
MRMTMNVEFGRYSTFTTMRFWPRAAYRVRQRAADSQIGGAVQIAKNTASSTIIRE